MPRPTRGDLLLTFGCACFIFCLGLGSGFLAWGQKACPAQGPVETGARYGDSDRAARRTAPEGVKKVFLPEPDLRIRIPLVKPAQSDTDEKSGIEEFGEMSIDVWEGGHRMPVPHLARTIERTARHMDIEPRKCVKALLEICAVESDFGIIVRQKGGPALSPWQIEPKTWDDILSELKERFPRDHERLRSLYDKEKPEAWNRAMNIPYAAATAMMYIKINYPNGFSGLSSLRKRAALWKRWYNTPKGKGTIERYHLKAREHLWNYLNS